MNPIRRTGRGVAVLLTAGLLLLTACDERVGKTADATGCPGPDAISADGRWILTSPVKPGRVRLVGRSDDAGTVRNIFAEGYGTAVNLDGTVVTAFSRRADSGVVWRRSTGEHTVIPRPAGSTVVIPTSISDDGRYVGVTAAAVPGGPQTGHVYDTITGRTTPIPGADDITQLVLTRNGAVVYVADVDGTIRRIERSTGATRTVATVSPDNPEPIEAVTRIGRLVVLNEAPDNRAGRLRLWDANTGRATTLPAPLVDGVAFDRVDISGDGKVLAATVFGADRTTGRTVRIVRGNGRVTEVAEVTESGRPVLSADGSVLAHCRSVTDGAAGRDVFAWVETG